MTKRVLESALEGEIAIHLGYEKHGAAGSGSGNYLQRGLGQDCADRRWVGRGQGPA
ncbi:transposase [Streptomyces bottropensis ATCC 25435]|uniref:Transposase n=1 Tax=Streptomyces bottropensis ATCC 25435 TaxID=1054862 RepID=M3EJK0_9ACTN|nr:transposase [Streptomyces bottropensis ATCC 25435]